MPFALYSLNIQEQPALNACLGLLIKELVLDSIACTAVYEK
jgi:hypothetical protein